MAELNQADLLLGGESRRRQDQLWRELAVPSGYSDGDD